MPITNYAYLSGGSRELAKYLSNVEVFDFMKTLKRDTTQDEIDTLFLEVRTANDRVEFDIFLDILRVVDSRKPE